MCIVAITQVHMVEVCLVTNSELDMCTPYSLLKVNVAVERLQQKVCSCAIVHMWEIATCTSMSNSIYRSLVHVRIYALA